jgi:hypothetical protein
MRTDYRAIRGRRSLAFLGQSFVFLRMGSRQDLLQVEGDFDVNRNYNNRDMG